VVGEPTSMQPIIAHKGTHRFRCAVARTRAHSSYVTHGVNAIEYAARLIVYIHRPVADRLAQIEKRDYGFTVPYSTLSTGLIRGALPPTWCPRIANSTSTAHLAAGFAGCALQKFEPTRGARARDAKG